MSIAGCELLLGAAILAAIYAWRKLEFPPIRLPLALFVAGTLLSLAFSTHPAAGFPQVKKLYLLLVLAVVVTAVRSAEYVRTMYLGCAAAGTASALWSLVQFWRKFEAARQLHQPFYTYYVGARITGFMSHWMTFGGQMSIALLLLVAVLMFASPPAKWRWAGYAAVAIMSAGLVLAFTRGMWFAALAGFLYLLARWRPKLLFAVPAIAVAAFFAAPHAVQERVESVYQPHGTVDSNQHRVVTWRTGVEMIKAHPLLGVGPEHVGKEFDRYIPGRHWAAAADRLVRPPAQHLPPIRRRARHPGAPLHALGDRQGAARRRHRPARSVFHPPRRAPRCGRCHHRRPGRRLL